MATAHKEKLLRQQMAYRIEDSLRIVRSEMSASLDEDENEAKNVDILTAVCKNMQMVMHAWDEESSELKKQRSSSAYAELECLLSSVNRNEDADPTTRLVTMVGDAISVLVECWPPKGKGPRAMSPDSGNEHFDDSASNFEGSEAFAKDEKAGSFSRMRGGSMRSGSGGFANTGFGGGQQAGQGGFGGQRQGSGGFGGGGRPLGPQQSTPFASPFERAAASRKTLPPNFPQPKVLDTRPLENEYW